MEIGQTESIHVPPGEGKSLWVAGFPHTLKATSEDTNGAYSFIEVSVPPQSGPPPTYTTGKTRRSTCWRANSKYWIRAAA